MMHGYVPERSLYENTYKHTNKEVPKAFPVRLTINSRVKLPAQLCDGGWRNRVSNLFKSLQKTKRPWFTNKVIYTGYITHEGLDKVMEVIAEFEGVTATVVCL